MNKSYNFIKLHRLINEYWHYDFIDPEVRVWFKKGNQKVISWQSVSVGISFPVVANYKSQHQLPKKKKKSSNYCLNSNPSIANHDIV